MIIKAKKHFNSIIMKTTVAFVALVAVCCTTAYSQNLFAEVGASDFATTAYCADSSAEYCRANELPLNFFGEAVKYDGEINGKESELSDLSKLIDDRTDMNIQCCIYDNSD